MKSHFCNTGFGLREDPNSGEHHPDIWRVGWQHPGLSLCGNCLQPADSGQPLACQPGHGRHHCTSHLCSIFHSSGEAFTIIFWSDFYEFLLITLIAFNILTTGERYKMIL